MGNKKKEPMIYVPELGKEVSKMHLELIEGVSVIGKPDATLKEKEAILDEKSREMMDFLMSLKDKV